MRSQAAALAETRPAPDPPMRTWSVWVGTVVRFVAFGPLIGGLPWNVMIFPIPISYLLGAVPAALAGSLYAVLMISNGRPFREESAFWRGAACGVLATACCLALFITIGGMPLILSDPLRITETDYPATVKAMLFYINALPLIAALVTAVLGGIAGSACAMLLPGSVGNGAKSDSGA